MIVFIRLSKRADRDTWFLRSSLGGVESEKRGTETGFFAKRNWNNRTADFDLCANRSTRRTLCLFHSWVFTSLVVNFQRKAKAIWSRGRHMGRFGAALHFPKGLVRLDHETFRTSSFAVQSNYMAMLSPGTGSYRVVPSLAESYRSR